jgi:uncharacterized protein (DUF58 family)
VWAGPAAFAAGIVAIVALVAWLITSPKSQPELILAVALTIAIVVDGVTAARALRALDVDVENPIDAVAGHPVTYVVRVTGVRRSMHVAPPAPLAAFGVVAHDEHPFYLTLPSPARGVVRSLTLDVRTAGPIGLFQGSRRARVTFTTPMYVGPPPIRHELKWPYLQTQRIGLTPTSQHGHDLFRGVREYVPGDSRRHVHWAATAHHRHLMVKEHEGTGVICLRVIATMPFFGLASDEATGRAAWLCEEGLRRGWEVRLVTVESAEVPAPPVLLRSGLDVQSVLPTAPALVRTVDLPVASKAQICRRLAAAVPGRVRLAGATAAQPGGRWKGPTRIITTGGDQWQ